jgi:excisionase family DNA binding protein
MKKLTSVITTDPLPPEPLDTLKDVARRLRCHKRTIARAVADGLLHPVRINSRLIRFRRSEVNRWIAQAEGGK